MQQYFNRGGKWMTHGEVLKTQNNETVEAPIETPTKPSEDLPEVAEKKEEVKSKKTKNKK